MNNWIRVEDQLPEVGKDVLLILKNYKKDMVVGYLYCENKFFIQCNIIESKNVTHWMELPEPPKENDE